MRSSPEPRVGPRSRSSSTSTGASLATACDDGLCRRTGDRLDLQPLPAQRDGQRRGEKLVVLDDHQPVRWPAPGPTYPIGSAIGASATRSRTTRRRRAEARPARPRPAPSPAGWRRGARRRRRARRAVRNPALGSRVVAGPRAEGPGRRPTARCGHHGDSREPPGARPVPARRRARAPGGSSRRSRQADRPPPGPPARRRPTRAGQSGSSASDVDQLGQGERAVLRLGELEVADAAQPGAQQPGQLRPVRWAQRLLRQDRGGALHRGEGVHQVVATRLRPGRLQALANLGDLGVELEVEQPAPGPMPRRQPALAASRRGVRRPTGAGRPGASNEVRWALSP